MNIIDVLILLGLGLGAVVGFARGFLRQTVQSLGGILVVVCAFIFRGIVSGFLMDIFPAIEFKSGIFKNISSMNILVYDIIAFIILLIVFGIVLRIIMSIATFIEKILNATIILAIPSKILGAVMGLVEAYVFIFIILFVLNIFSFRFLNQSEYKERILEGTPVMSNLAAKTVASFKDINALRDELETEVDRLELDKKVLKILIDNNIVTEKKVDELYEEGKLNTKNKEE